VPIFTIAIKYHNGFINVPVTGGDRAALPGDDVDHGKRDGGWSVAIRESRTPDGCSWWFQCRRRR